MNISTGLHLSQDATFAQALLLLSSAVLFGKCRVGGCGVEVFPTWAFVGSVDARQTFPGNRDQYNDSVYYDDYSAEFKCGTSNKTSQKQAEN